ncbi:MAG TPA: 6-hydroxymethylpterin diphosphokinase MptE-like protein [Thermoplasmata archaeon]|nr:6-hydroxymethylpterin diphosphokinase MptE-like protein [Thermoplasmata archaeon]
MEYSQWAPRYEEIGREFGYPFERELEAADLLDQLLDERSRRNGLGRARGRIGGRTAIVVGGARGFGAPPVWRLAKEHPSPSLLAADGATVPCVEAGLVPDVIVTDLDGPVPAEVNANMRGALAVIHAHGDNRTALERWVPEFGGEVAGSWAGPPRPALLNVGGFTDGDRAAYLAEACGARRILLWGFAFDELDPRASGPVAVKRRKLAWARRLLGELAAAGASPIALWGRDGAIRDYPGIVDPSSQ